MNYLILLISIKFYSFCIEGDPFCARCGGDECLLCYHSFSSASGVCNQSKSAIENCISWESATRCSLCNYGFRVNLTTGKCESIGIDNCLRADLNGDCLLCDEQTLPKEGKCESSDNCDTDNCDICSNSGGVEKCYKCARGLVLHTYHEDNDY